MKKFILKSIIIIVIVVSILAGLNYMVDPSNIFHPMLINKISDSLVEGRNVEIKGNFDERLMQEKLAQKLNEKPDILVLGSSHVIYIPFEEEGLRNAAVSAGELWDLYGLTGIYEYYDKLPDTMIIGVDPWIFNDNSGGTMYESINSYVEYEKNRVNGIQTKSNVSNANKYTHLKELISVSYFQDSFKELRSKGIQDKEQILSTVDDSKMGECAKILSNGIRVPAITDIKSSENIEQTAQKIIDSDEIYHSNNYYELSDEKVEWFEKLICYLQQEKKIHVILYLPVCYPQPVYDYVKETPQHLGVVKAEEYLLEFADKNEIDIYGSYNPSLSEIDFNDFMDELHVKPESSMKTFMKRN